MSDASPRRRLRYESGEWEIDVARRELRARGAPVPIGSRAVDIIEVLFRSAAEPFQTTICLRQHPTWSCRLRCRRYRGRHARTEMLPVANCNFAQRRTSMISQNDLRQRYPMNRRAFVSSLLERLLDRTLLIQMTCATVYL